MKMQIELDMVLEGELEAELARLVEELAPELGVALELVQAEGPTGWPLVRLTAPAERFGRALQAMGYEDELEYWLGLARPA